MKLSPAPLLEVISGYECGNVLAIILDGNEVV